MKNLKLLYSLLIVFVAGVIASCTTDSTYTPGEIPAGPQVSFSNENASSLDLAGEPGDEVQNIVLTRIVTEGELTVAILADAGENDAIFTVPETVTFADGEGSVNLAIGVDCAALVEDKVYELSLLIADEAQTTPYGNSSWHLAVKLFPWTLIKTEQINYGKMRGGDVFTYYFNVATYLAEVDVNVYQHKSTEGLYLIEDPWAAVMAPTFDYPSVEDLLADGISHTTAHLVINCVNPEKCYIEKQSMGIEVSGVGALDIASDYHPEDNPEGIAGTFDVDNKVITWGNSGLVFYVDGEAYSGNDNGAFRIVFPGGQAVDYALEVDYKGITVSPDGKSVDALFAFTHGADVQGVKYYIADGNVLADPAAAKAALLDGSAEGIAEVADFVVGAGTTNLTLKIENAEVYTIIAAPIDKNGALVEKFIAMESFYYTGLGQLEDHPCEVTLTVGKYSDYATEADQENSDTADYNAIGYNIKGKDIKTLRIGAILTSELNEYLAEEGKSYETLIQEMGLTSPTINELAPANSEAGLNGALTGLEADSDYTVFAMVVTDYEVSKVVTQTYKTAVAPAYSGELKVGKYLLKYKGKEYDTIMTLESNQGSSTKFLVKNLGYEDGTVWHAVYDAEAGTLTLDGTIKGREKEGIFFGDIYGDMDEDTVYGYYSIAAKDPGGNMADPLVFTVDAETKQLSGITNKRFAIYTKKSSDTSSKIYRQFDNTKKTSIAPYVEEPGE